MKKYSILIILFTLLITNIFGQSENIIADHYKTRKFNVAIFPETSFDLISGKRFTPSRVEIDKAENTLKQKLKKLNSNLTNQSSTPIIHRKLRKYKRQYFGYYENNSKILLINFFWEKRNQRDNNEQWLKERIQVNDGGSYYWEIKYNIDTDEFFALEINGYG
jgi:hypothetical protein